MRFIIGVIILVLLGFYPVNSQSGSSQGSAYEGKHFVLGFMQNEIDNLDPLTLQIIIVSSYPADIVVNVSGEPTSYYSIKADSVLKLFISNSMEIVEVERPIRKTVEILSTVPVLVYTFNSRQRSSDCFTAVPVSQWGNEYVVMSFPNDQYWSSYQRTPYPDLMIPRKSEFVILASEDNTKVTITPKAMTHSKRSQNIPFDVYLNKGEAYLVQSYDYQMGQGDLTGSIVRSSKPVGVISGHMRTAVPQFMDYTDESKDHIAVMLTPTSSWARQFYSSPYEFHSGGDLFRITNIFDNTMVTVENMDTSYIVYLDKPGTYVTLPGIKKATKWTANHPVQIGQYMMRTGADDDHDYYDPSLVLLPPAEQFVSKIIFQTVGSDAGNPNQYIGYGVNLIVEEIAIPTLKIDNEPVLNIDDRIWNNKFPNSNHRWIQLQVSSGKHSITCDTGSFSGIAFGYGFADSYSVTLGSSLVNPYSDDSVSPELIVDDYCSNISGTISEVMDGSSSGLLFAYMSDRSYNYKCDIPKLYDETDEVRFTAEPIDNLKNGRFILEYRDKNGNGGKYEYFHYGIGLNVRDTINFREVNKGDSISFFISNLSNGNKPVRLDSVRFEQPIDDRLYLNEENTPPVVLNYGEKYNYVISFAPKNSYEKLNQKLYYYYDCDRYDSTLIIGSVIFPELTAIGHDFGEICLGETGEGQIKIFNNGNVAVTIESLEDIQIDVQFSIDTLDTANNSIFPVVIQKDDSLVINAFFKPMNTGNYDNINSALNDLNLPNEILLTGTGIAPLVEPVEINWGKRRIGTVNDSVFYLKNTGKCNAEVSFLDYGKNDDTFGDDEIVLLETAISQQDSILLNCSFNPVKTEDSELIANLKVDSPNHKSVEINLKGEGTIPVIKPVRIDFDTIYVGSSVDSNAIILHNLGNERLWFDYKRTEGDDSCFAVNDNDMSILKNQYLNESDYYIIPVRFNPKKTGYNEIAIIINHDAYPAYQKGDTAVIMSGYAKPLDILQPLISFENDIKYLPCNDNIFNLKLTNNGNFGLLLDSLIIISTDIDAQWQEQPLLPLLIAPEGFEEFRLVIIPRADKNGSIQLKAVFNDTIVYLSENVPVENKTYPIQIDNPGLITFDIGNDSSVVISGKFPHGSEIPVGFEFDINVDASYLYLLQQFTVLKVVTHSDTAEYIIELSQTSSKVFGKVFDDITITDSSEWFFELKFLALLSETRKTELEINVESNMCYLPGEIILNSYFFGVCQFDIRKVLFNENSKTEVFLYPNPVSEELCIKINLLRDSWLNLSLFDQKGKKIALYENFNLKKGLHYLIFEVSPIASGTYFMSAMTDDGVENIMFIINK